MSLKDKNVLKMLIDNDDYDNFLNEYLNYHKNDIVVDTAQIEKIDIAKKLSDIMTHQLDLLNISKVLWEYKPIYIKELRISKLKRLLD